MCLGTFLPIKSQVIRTLEASDFHDLDRYFLLPPPFSAEPHHPQILRLKLVGLALQRSKCDLCILDLPLNMRNRFCT